jgi:hypothetical protein
MLIKQNSDERRFPTIKASRCDRTVVDSQKKLELPELKTKTFISWSVVTATTILAEEPMVAGLGK